MVCTIPYSNQNMFENYFKMMNNFHKIEKRTTSLKIFNVVRVSSKYIDVPKLDSEGFFVLGQNLPFRGGNCPYTK
jgi:hypothetical protein